MTLVALVNSVFEPHLSLTPVTESGHHTSLTPPQIPYPKSDPLDLTVLPSVLGCTRGPVSHRTLGEVQTGMFDYREDVSILRRGMRKWRI